MWAVPLSGRLVVTIIAQHSLNALRELRGSQINSLLKTSGMHFTHEQSIRAILSGRDGELMYKGHTSASLLEVISSGFLRPTNTGHVCHRIAVFDCENAGDSPVGVNDDDNCGSTMHVLDIVSQSDMIKCAAFVVLALPPCPSLVVLETNDLRYSECAQWKGR